MRAYFGVLYIINSDYGSESDPTGRRVSASLRFDE